MVLFAKRTPSLSGLCMNFMRIRIFIKKGDDFCMSLRIYRFSQKGFLFPRGEKGRAYEGI